MNDKNYPIKKTWVIKRTLPIIFILFFYEFFFSIFLAVFLTNLLNLSDKITNIIIIINILIIYILTFSLIMLIINWQRSNFHFQFEEKFIILEQGIFNKQKRYIPYSVIQNVSLDYDFIDKFFGLANLIIENASSGGGINNLIKLKKPFFYIRNLGFKNNQVNILGLDKKKAEDLKLFILKKIKEQNLQDQALIINK